MNRLQSQKLMFMSIILLLALLMSACGLGQSSQSSPGESPLSEQVPSATWTADELVKIDPELLAVIEWDETHPGKGQEVAPDNFIFDSERRIHCIVHLDLKQDIQIARQLIIHHDGLITSERIFSNFVSLSCFISLDRIKRLAKENMIIEIFPNEIIPATNE